ncbi:hypothetical protein ACET3X_007767 [Alternaria dauci]|uniref:BTB domain-containing protein n=1 Tax=Alternaria dauci TaxID=48095 RepID=A0ABR3UFI3_9PLEO
MAGVAQKQILASLKGFLKSGAYSDLTITCGNDKHKVHKVIVCERAEFFVRTLKFGGIESQSGIIDLPEDEPAIVKLLMQYLYEGEYKPLLPDTDSSTAAPFARVQKVAKQYRSRRALNGSVHRYGFPNKCNSSPQPCNEFYICPHHECDQYHGSTTGANCYYQCPDSNCNECNPPNPLPSLNGKADQLLLHAKMYEIADKYDVVGLKDLVIEKFHRACIHFWNDDKFSVAAHHVFSTTPDHDEGLRNIVSSTISAHMELIKKTEVNFLLEDFEGLALGILEEKIKEYGW